MTEDTKHGPPLTERLCWECGHEDWKHQFHAVDCHLGVSMNAYERRICTHSYGSYREAEVRYCAACGVALSLILPPAPDNVYVVLEETAPGLGRELFRSQSFDEAAERMGAIGDEWLAQGRFFSLSVQRGVWQMACYAQALVTQE